MNKSVFIVAVFFAFSIAVKSQSIGVRAGIMLPELSNFLGSDFKKTTNISPKVGAFVNVKLSEKISIQPEVVYELYDFNVEGTDNVEYNSNTYPTNFKTSFKIDYIAIPVLIRYQILKAVNLELGPKFNFLLSKKGEGEVDNNLGSATIESQDLDDLIQKFNVFGVDKISGDTSKMDVGIVGGVNVDLPKSFGVNARYYVGFIDLFDVNSTNENLKARNVSLSLTLSYTF
ncbi:MAG: PorT family protein [Flavobacteriales bacterium]|nr:PorT family protein [Flavobacteriales bacterium]